MYKGRKFMGKDMQRNPRTLIPHIGTNNDDSTVHAYDLD